MGPLIGDVWTTRVFRDGNLQLRVFKLAAFYNLSVGVIDKEDLRNSKEGTERIIWFAKSDLQFMDCLQSGKADEKGN